MGCGVHVPDGRRTHPAPLVHLRLASWAGAAFRQLPDWAVRVMPLRPQDTRPVRAAPGCMVRLGLGRF